MRLGPDAANMDLGQVIELLADDSTASYKVLLRITEVRSGFEAFMIFVRLDEKGWYDDQIIAIYRQSGHDIETFISRVMF